METATCKVTQEEEIKLRNELFNPIPVRTAIVLIGGPASGKSTVIDHYLFDHKWNKQSFVTIDPDHILTNLSEFKRLKEHDHKTAASICYSVAADINNRNLAFALQNFYNIIFDGTGREFDWTSQHLINGMLISRGYTVHLCIVKLDVEIAKQRAKSRGEITGRVVDANVIESIHNQVNSNIPKYMKLDFVDTASLYDNSDTTPKLMELSAKGVTQSGAGIKIKKSLDTCTIPELKARAAERGVSLTGCNRKAEMIAKLRSKK